MLAWLGELQDGIAVEDAQAAIEIVEFFDAHRIDSSTQAPKCLRDKQATERAMNAMRTIGVTENEWWRRIWTLQEAVLPARAAILWGPCQIAWSTILNGSNHQIPYELGKFIHRNPSNFQSYNNLITQIRGIEIQKENGSGPLMAAYRWSFRKTTDPLDKVYAFIGLFHPGTFRRAECCDYKLPAATVYAMFTADLIKHHKSFHPITIFGLNRFHEKRTANLPSWAVDMGIDGYKLSVPSLCREGDSWAWLSMNNYNMYNASGNLEIDWKHFDFGLVDGSLSVSAMHVDEICTVGPALSSETTPDQDMIAQITESYNTANEFYHAQHWLDPALR